jgi:hypothetical protein
MSGFLRQNALFIVLQLLSPVNNELTRVLQSMAFITEQEANATVGQMRGESTKGFIGNDHH